MEEVIKKYPKKKSCVNLSHKNLTVLPENLKNLSSVEHLLLNENNLIIPPSEIAIFADTLTELILSNNNLTVFPQEFGKLKLLKVLDLSCNKIGVLSSEIGNLTSLSCLWLNNCNLLQIPNEIRHLKLLCYLGIRENELQVLPKELKELCQLRWLNCSHNHLKNTNDITLADEVFYVNLSNNKLDFVPSLVKGNKLVCT